MTTTIKAIVCPRCGSTEHETLEAGRQYRCSSCGTEFFLDSDRKEVLVQHKVIREEGGSWFPVIWILLSVRQNVNSP